jgi:hypothetical protein
MKHEKERIEEIQLFIIWQNARKETTKLLTEIKTKFTINQVYEISWTPNNVIHNLKRFYGITLPDPEKKARQCGKGSFLLVIVTDKHPIHGIRGTSMGKQLVNTNMYNTKRKIRQIVAGEYPIHGSIHEKEANHNLTLLLGKNITQLRKECKKEWDKEIKFLNSDLIGTGGWKNLEQLLFVLNNTTNYVILRNFEKFPDISDIKNDGDIDLLTDDLWQIPYVLNFEKQINGDHSGFNRTKIDSNSIKFDIKYVGDNYLDEKWSKNILKHRKKTDSEYYIPSKEDHFFSLLYHIVYQKTEFSKKYHEKLTELIDELGMKKVLLEKEKLTEILDDFMKKNGYRYSNSLIYKINHNEVTRLSYVIIKVLKHEGITELFRAVKGKIKRTIKK